MQQCRSPMQLRLGDAASVAPMQHALRRGAASYAWSLQHRHLLTTTSSGALLGVAGDALTQLSADGTYDSRRGAAFGAFGAVLTGPINYVWLGGLQRAVQFVAPAGGAAAVASKVAAQSTVMQPFIYLPTFSASRRRCAVEHPTPRSCARASSTGRRCRSCGRAGRRR